MNLNMAPDTPVRLVQFTDCHLRADPNGTLRGVATLASLKACVARAREALPAWDATLLTGDLVQDEAGGYRHLYDVFAEPSPPVYCVPGNHDEPAAMRSELRAAPFSQDGHADFGPWRIVMLDTRVEGEAYGYLRDTELARLDERLGEAGVEHALVCLHHHPVSMGSQWLDEVGLKNAAAFFEILDRHATVRGVVWGHVHQEYSGRRGQIALYGTPSTCTQFKPRVDGFATDLLPPAYRSFELASDGAVSSHLEWVPLAEPARRAQAG